MDRFFAFQRLRALLPLAVLALPLLAWRTAEGGPPGPAPSAASAPVLEVAEPHPSSSVERDLCLTVAVGAGAAAECGELRLTHSLPTVRTMNKARTPLLLFNSQHAHPHPLVAANVMLPGGTDGLRRVVATLRVNGLTRAQSVYRGAAWPGAGPVRIAVGYDAATGPTNLVRYTLTVTSVYASGTGEARDSARLGGELVVINRAKSPFGAGWWLAGLDRLLLDFRGNPVLWIGGDGSARRYLAAGEGRWAAESVDRPDTLVRSGSGFARPLPGGVRVEFDSAGRHAATVNRLGHRTAFEYDAAGRLERIRLPVPQGGTERVYAFRYGTDTRLQTVEAPGAGDTARLVALQRSGTTLTLTDPDGHSVAFGCDAAGRINSRTDRRGYPTLYRYGAAGRFAASRLDLESGDSIVHRLEPVESRGLVTAAGTGAVPAEAGYTLLDGPRDNVTDVVDQTRIWPDRWGAPRRIVNALGRETLLTRSDARFPALVTEVRRPNGYITRAEYDSRGNLATSIGIGSYGDGRNDTTRYVRSDTRWPDFVTRSVLPEGEASEFGYDARGNRVWQQVGEPGHATVYDPGRVDSTRVVLAYDAGTGLFAALALPGAARPDSALYDRLGNARMTVTPLGYRSLYLKDALGRDTLVVTPTDTVSARDSTQLLQKGVRQRLAYDAADRVATSSTWGPAMSHHPAQSVTVQTDYDEEGNALAVVRTMDPDTNRIGTMTTAWRYDAAGRAVAEIAADGRTDSTTYNPAGLAVEWHSRRSDPVLGRTSVFMRYDALGRLEERLVPSVRYPRTRFTLYGREWSFPLHPLDADRRTDSVYIAEDRQNFRYDAAGNLTAADNRHARVARHYYPGGAVRADTLRIRDFFGSGFDTHVYGLSFEYDRNGRRTRLRHPAQLAQGAGIGDSVAYAYNARTGHLASVTDLTGHAFTFAYDAAGQLAGATLPGGLTESRTYNPDRLLKTRKLTADNPYVGTPEGLASGSVRNDAFTYDARGKIAGEYTGLGALASWSMAEAGVYDTRTLWVDPLGNLQREDRKYTDANFEPPVTGSSRTYTYSSDGAARLRRTETRSRATDARVLYEDDTNYDAAGNKSAFESHQLLRTQDTGGADVLREHSRYFYGADGKLRVADRQRCVTHSDAGTQPTCVRWPQSDGHEPGVFEEYRYDALGRRVMTRSRFDPQCTYACADTRDRVVWDGAQLLWEIRSPDSEDDAPTGRSHGRVAYTHGGGIDAPLSLVRAGIGTVLGDGAALTILPHANWRGLYDLGTFADGSVKKPDLDLREIAWPARNYTAFLRDVPPEEPKERVWLGSIITSHKDASGQLYRRNRYYDPVAGRFTQEDPIGLAGGLNLYGFAGGDPVNFSDPFGLSPCKGFWDCIRGFASYQWRGFQAGADVTRTSINFDEEGQFGALVGRLSLALPTARAGGAGVRGAAARPWFAPAAHETRVSRWVSEAEFGALRESGTLQVGANGRTYVTSVGAPKPGGTGPVRVDFNVPADALQKASQADWYQIFSSGRNIPITGITRVQ